MRRPPTLAALGEPRGSSEREGEQADQRFPDVVDAELRATGAGRGPFAIPARVTEVTVEVLVVPHPVRTT